MRRRDFIFLGGVAAWPLAAQAQQPAIPLIGFLGSASPDLWARRMRAFHDGLNETGFIEGRNVAIEYRWAEGRNDRLAALAAGLVDRQVAVIAAPGSTPAALAAKAATGLTPIVFEISGDPIELGLVASLSRPGGNITGVTSLNADVTPKRLELLRELVPAAKVVGLLVNRTSPNVTRLTEKSARAAASTLGFELSVQHASTERELDTVFATLARLRADALLIGPDGFFSSRPEYLGMLSVRHRLPSAYQLREFTAAGGLMSYGIGPTESFRLVGVYTGRILKGEKSAELPVQQSTKVEFFLNLKTAKELGLTIPHTLLARADEVIE